MQLSISVSDHTLLRLHLTEQKGRGCFPPATYPLSLLRDFWKDNAEQRAAVSTGLPAFSWCAGNHQQSADFRWKALSWQVREGKARVKFKRVLAQLLCLFWFQTPPLLIQSGTQIYLGDQGSAPVCIVRMCFITQWDTGCRTTPFICNNMSSMLFWIWLGLHWRRVPIHKDKKCLCMGVCAYAKSLVYFSTGRKDTRKREAKGRRWMSSSSSMGLIHLICLLFVRAIFTGGSVGFMGQCIEKVQVGELDLN